MTPAAGPVTVSAALSVSLTIAFHSRFLVGTAHGRNGLDLAVDHDTPLPTTHLKGLLRDSATQILRLPAPLVERTFGTAAHPTAWSFGDVTPAGGWRFRQRHRVAIDRTSHAARPDHIVHDERAWAPAANATITWYGPGTPPAEQHLTLRAAAVATRHLGSWRRRGLGHVSITTDPPLSEDDLAAVLALRNEPEQS